MRIVHALALSACALVLAGCTSTRQFVPLPDQSKAVEDPTKGRIYVIRPARVGSAISMAVSEDGKLIGRTGPRGFLCWERPPGETIVSATAEGVSSVPLSLRAGQVLYIFQHLRMGMWIARNELELVDEKEGKKILKKCKRPKIESPPAAPIKTTKATGTDAKQGN